MSRNTKTISVQCPCGTEFLANSWAVQNGRGKYCSRSCLYTYRPINHFTHGQTAHPLYELWKNMNTRCSNDKVPTFKHYGGRGISVHPEWHDVVKFIEWVEANLGTRPEGMSLDRIDNDGNYEPGNVRWATQTEQIANRRCS